MTVKQPDITWPEKVTPPANADPNYFRQNMLQHWPDTDRGSGRTTKQLMSAIQYVLDGTTVYYVHGKMLEISHSKMLMEKIYDWFRPTYPLLPPMQFVDNCARFVGRREYIKFTSMASIASGSLRCHKVQVIIDHAAYRRDIHWLDIDRAMREIKESRCPYE